MPNELKIVIDADISKGEQGIKTFGNTVTGEFNKISQSANALTANINKSLGGIGNKGIVVPIEVQTAQAQANVNTLSETIETLRAKIEARKSFINVETDITKIAAYNKEIQSLEARMRSIQNVGKKGFELFLVPNQTINSVKSLSQQVAAFGGGVKTYIPPAITGFQKLPNAITPVITQLKSLEATAKASGASLASSFTKAYSGLRTLANILPGIGIGGIIGVAVNAISEITEGLFKASAAAVRHSDVIEGASDSYAKAITNVNELKLNIQLAKEGFISKDAVVKQYNESIGKTTGFVKNLDEAEKELGKNADAYVKFTLLKAAANFALEEASKKAVKAALIPQEDIKKNLNFFQRLNLPFEKAPSRRTQEQKFLAPVIAGVLKEEEDLEKIADDFQRKAAELAKKFGFNFFDKTLPKGQTDDTLARAKAFIKEFGDVFVVPDLEITFTNTEAKVKAAAKKLLSDIDKGLLILKTFGARQVQIPVELGLQVDEKGIPNDLKKIRDNLLKNVNIFGDNTKIIKGIVPGASEDVAKRNKAFFDDFQKSILATAGLVDGVLTPAFSGLFDAIIEGQNPMKAFFDGLKESVNQLIKKLIQAAVQAAVLKALGFVTTGGASSFGGIFSSLLGGAFGGQANRFPLGGAIGSRAFNNVIQITGGARIAGNDIVLSYNRTNNSNVRNG